MIADPLDKLGEAQAQRLEQVSEHMSALLRRPEVAQRLRTIPGENEWSALQIVGHMVEMIPYWMNHCRTLIAATGEPPRFGRTLDAPERLAGVERGALGDPDGLLRVLNDEVQAAATTIRQQTSSSSLLLLMPKSIWRRCRLPCRGKVRDSQ